MTREDLVHEIYINLKSKKKRLNKPVIDQLLRCLTGELTKGLERGERIRIVGFGTFEAKMKAPYRRINPRTKEEMIVEARMEPIFKPGKELKKCIPQ